MMGFLNYWKTAIEERLGNLKLALSFFFSCSPKSAFLLTLVIILEGLFPLLLVHITRDAVNQFSAYEELSEWIIGPGLLFVFALIGRETLSMLSSLLSAYHEGRVSDFVNTRAQSVAASADMIQFESSEFYDHLYRAGFESDQHVVDVINHLAALTSGGITLIGILLIVGQYSLWLPVLFLIAALPIFLTLLTQAHHRYHWNQKMTLSQRKSRYYNWLLVGQEAAGEVRIYGLRDLFLRKYKALRQHILGTRVSMEQRQALWTTAANISSIMLLSGGVIYMLRSFQNGFADAGAVALIGHSVLLCRQSANTLLGETANLYRATLFLKDLDHILRLKSTIVSPPSPQPFDKLSDHSIRFSKVDFTYPNGSTPALYQLTATIPAKKITVILGKNGSGKSTLAKLICRFFDPESGEVSIGGVNIKQLDPEQLRQHLGILFQSPVPYYFSAKENVTLGCVKDMESTERYQKALAATQADSLISKLPEGDHTQLGTWFQDGTELSGGEWQRLALARSYYADRSIWILDEPTSAMDPWAEQRWLKHLQSHSEDRTILIITHRITTAEIADHVIVLDKGKVVESGAPETLMGRGGMLAALKKSARDPKNTEP